jgi:cytosine/adenosine deaminase-related metal-dependent hydrolase
MAFQLNDAARALLSEPSVVLAPAWVLTSDGTHRQWACWVHDGRFEWVGPRAELQAELSHVPWLELPTHLLMPGLIDAHTHLTQSMGKSLAFGEPSEIFRRIWVPMEQALGPEAVALSTRLACLEALRGGFTTVVDAGTRSADALDVLAREVERVGIRCVLGAIVNDSAPGLGPVDTQALARFGEQHLQRFEHHALIAPSLAVSIPEVATDAMLQIASRLCREARVPFQTHANEHLVAVERSLVAREKRPIELLHALGALNPFTLLAHATLLTPRELRYLQEAGAAVTYNPVASQWKGNAVLDALSLHEQGVPFALGTDGTRYDGFRLMDAAEASQRLVFGLARGDFSCGGGWVWVDHATYLGARAIGLHKRTGQIQAGLAADYLLVDVDVPELTPSWDLTWEAVRLMDRAQIDAVAVNGKLRLWQGWPVDWDGRALLREVRELAHRQVPAAPIHRIHATADAHRGLFQVDRP